MLKHDAAVLQYILTILQVQDHVRAIAIQYNNEKHE